MVVNQNMKFTFHHVSIKTCAQFPEMVMTPVFTFHHVSIKTQGEQETN